MVRILGIDPGSVRTGYGCINSEGNQITHVCHGTLKLAMGAGAESFGTVPYAGRLASLFHGLSDVIKEFKPHILSVEKVFFAKNAVSALKLGQARGVVIVVGSIHGLEVVEYSATEVKLAVVGHGRADKEQVARMVQVVLGKKTFDSFDASDALALAICHAQFSRRGSKAASSGSRKRNISMAKALGLE